MPQELLKWLEQFQENYFSYSDGFYHFPYNGTSPERLVDSFKDLPFVRHSAERQCVSGGAFHPWL